MDIRNWTAMCRLKWWWINKKTSISGAHQLNNNKQKKTSPGIFLTRATAINAPPSSATFLLMFAQEIERTFSPLSKNLICWMPGWSSLNKTCSDTRFQMSNLPVSDDTIYFPSGVISAWVTMAPKWLSASLDRRRPDRNSQTPTQLLVTVAARSVCDKLPIELNRLVTKITRLKVQQLPYIINLELVPIDHMDLFENIIDIPDLNGTIDGRCDDAVPVANSQRFKLNYATEMSVQYFKQLPRFQTPNI